MRLESKELILQSMLGSCALLSSSKVWILKKMFSRFALLVSSLKICTSFSKVGIDDFVDGVMKDFRVDHQSLEDKVFDCSLLDS